MQDVRGIEQSEAAPGLVAEYLRRYEDRVVSRAAKMLEARHEALYERVMSELWTAMTSVLQVQRQRVKLLTAADTTQATRL